MSDNVFRILGVESKEDVVSNLLAHLINHSAEFAREFVQIVTVGGAYRYDAIRAYTRTAVPEAGVPDIVLKAKRADGCDLFIIECKLKASEGRDQTKRYGEPGMIDGLKCKLGDQEPSGDLWSNSKPWLSFLTLFPDQKPDNVDFQLLTFEAIIPALKRVSLEPRSRSDILRTDLLDLLDGFYSSVFTSFDAPASAYLDPDLGMDAAFLSFVKLMDAVSQEAGIPIDHSRRPSWTGRKTFFSVFRRDSWVYQGPLSGVTREVHFEPTLDCLYDKKRISIFVHSEMSPYKPKRQIGDHVIVNAMERENHDLADYLGSAGVPGLKTGRRWNMVGKLSVSFNDVMTLGKLKSELVNALSTLIPLIDRYFTPPDDPQTDEGPTMSDNVIRSC